MKRFIEEFETYVILPIMKISSKLGVFIVKHRKNEGIITKIAEFFISISYSFFLNRMLRPATSAERAIVISTMQKAYETNDHSIFQTDKLYIEVTNRIHERGINRKKN